MHHVAQSVLLVIGEESASCGAKRGRVGHRRWPHLNFEHIGDYLQDGSIHTSAAGDDQLTRLLGEAKETRVMLVGKRLRLDDAAAIGRVERRMIIHEKRFVALWAVADEASGRESRRDLELVVVEGKSAVVADARLGHATVEMRPVGVLRLDRVAHELARHGTVLVHEHHHVGVGVERVHEDRALVGVRTRTLRHRVHTVRSAERYADL